jgi:hypothetical protein
VQRASGIPCSLFSFEGRFHAKPGRIAPRDLKVCLEIVIESEAIQNSFFAQRDGLLLLHGLLRFDDELAAALSYPPVEGSRRAKLALGSTRMK